MTKDDILNALVEALKERDAPPSPAEGWLDMKGLMAAMELSEPVIRRRLRALNGKLERKMHAGHAYYRIKP